MHHITFDKNTEYKTAILIKLAALSKGEMLENYVKPLGISHDEIIGFSVDYNNKNKCPAALIKDCLDVLLPALDSLEIKTLFVCDSAYFKKLTGESKAECHLGYVLPCTYKGFEHMKVIYGVNHQSLFHNPLNSEKMELSVKTLRTYLHGQAVVIGSDVIHQAIYPNSNKEIKNFLDSLLQYPELACDTETFSLQFWKAGLGTIGFAWDEHNGGAFCVDYKELVDFGDDQKLHGKQHINPYIRGLIRDFFVKYKGKFIYHNANYDVKILIYALFMNDPLDQQGLITGLNILCRDLDDTKIITYLAINSCARNNLKLKDLAHEYTGNYAQEDIDDIRLIPKAQLLEYNLVDCLATWYVYKKQAPKMIADEQLPVYANIMKPSIKAIAQMELTGMPLDMPQVKKVDKYLTQLRTKYTKRVMQSPIIKKYLLVLQQKEMDTMHAGWKKKTEPFSYFDYVKFNPASGPQLIGLLYDYLGFKIIDKTKTKLPATGAKTIAKLVHHTKDPAEIVLLEALIELGKVSKILDTFIKAFYENSFLKADGIYYLHGNFNLGGTVSGRLSSSGPNLQNLPSNSTYAKIIKSCFIAPAGWLMCGADFDSLEDKISALTTKDPNKLKVYMQGFDGHCLRAFSYFGSQMTGIVNTVASINSIAELYPLLRQDSKMPTFALTYQGTYHTLMNNLGLPRKEAQGIEREYHDLYKVADEWVQDKLIEASNVGYVTTAFGLRVRTPILKRCILNTQSTPYEAQSEGRTAGNALGQGYGLLNNRAAIEFQQRILASPYAMDIKPIAHIHDAMYFIVRNNLEIVKWFNSNLPECMAWQKLPELEHDIVKLSGGVELFYPNWAVTTKLPNCATQQEIYDICLASANQQNES